jgi:hypothetical protein
MTIRTRDLMPIFTATNRGDGTLVDYRDIWQKKNLVLVVLPKDDPTASAYAASLSALEAEAASYEARLIVTTTRIEGIPSPGVVIADRWGDVYHVKDASRSADLPEPRDLLEWLQYVRNECPECQGETR